LRTVDLQDDADPLLRHGFSNSYIYQLDYETSEGSGCL